MVGGHTGAGLDEIKLLAVSLSKSQSRQSPHCLFCCSLLPLHQCLHFNGNWNNSHTLSPDAAHSEALTKACKDTLGGVTAGIQLENSGPHSAPTSVLLLDYLRLYWLFYHIKDRCQSVSRAGFMMCVTTNHLIMQYDYKIGFEYPIL